ncbi:MAG: hypothetical protein QM652_06965 [Legionella sp.]|uniref:hypothetical protein n=1 Tax=Legionella sp. TaxID=459 RepID=UPI0039E35C8F
MNNKNNQNIKEIICDKLNDLMIPGFVIEFTPEEADTAGAFIEDALDEHDAMEAIYG